MAGMPGRSGGARPGAGRKRGPNYDGSHKARPVAISEDSAPCFVYVIYEVDEPGYCKIGVATDVVKRFSALQVGSWRVMRLAHVEKLPSKSAAHTIERQVHQAISALHCRGEWFRVPVDRATNEVKLAVSQLQSAFDAIAMVQSAEAVK